MTSIIRQLPLDRYVTSGSKSNPKHGDAISWQKYDIITRVWRVVETAIFGTTECDLLGDKFNQYYLNIINKIL